MSSLSLRMGDGRFIYRLTSSQYSSQVCFKAALPEV
jgi:hypothetical protein